MSKKISSKEFHEIFCGIVSAGECIGYGPDRQKAFEHGWSEAMNRVYARLVDTSLDGELDEDGQATAAYAEAHEESLAASHPFRHYRHSGSTLLIGGSMNADQVMKYAKAKWPQVMKSEIADTVAAGSDVLKAFDDAAEAGIINRQIKYEAISYAIDCLRLSDGWDVETLSHNIESNFPELSADECDKISEAAIAKAKGEA